MRMNLFVSIALWMGLIPMAHGEGSVIRIDFADPDLPSINVSGKIAVQPYGVYDSPALERARAEAALKMPPPAFEAFSLVWQPVHTIQTTILQGGPALDAAGFPVYSDPGVPRVQSVDNLNDWQAFPLYDREEYLAELAAWKREQLRARIVLGR